MKTIALGISGLIITAAVAGCMNTSTSSSSPQPTRSASAVAHSSAPKSVLDPSGYACAALGASGYCPRPAAAPTITETASAATVVTPTATTAPAITNAEQQAVESAQSYLDMGSGFSEAGLLQQLTSSYGAGFSTADAQFAINYIKPNWDTQAVLSAKGYMAMGGFSRESLIQQLTSSYGAGFTEAQAKYAVSKVGL
jgi:Host cell surface-exposed lipoprotein